MLIINTFGLFAEVKVQSARLNRLKTYINKSNIFIWWQYNLLLVFWGKNRSNFTI